MVIMVSLGVLAVVFGCKEGGKKGEEGGVRCCVGIQRIGFDV